MKLLQKYASFIKLEHTLFSIPLLFSGAVLARNKWPPFRISLLILIAGSSARVVAMTLNRILDRNIDKINPRTASRHLPSGNMKLWEAWITVVVGLALYLYSTWLLSDFCLKYSWIPLVAFVLYPMFKRFTKWTHVGLGLVWSLVPLGGFFAVEPSLKGIWPVLILSLFCVFWLAGFDIIYATLDEQFDRESGVYSLPAAWGSKRALKLAGTFHLLSFIALFFLYGIFLSGPVTVMILAMIGILLYLEQKFSHYVDLAFFQINAVIGFFVLFFVIAGIKGV